MYDFNTSHVTVYHRTIIENVHVYVFQYISCYCLSPSHWEWPPGVWISIHLMLLFIGVKVSYPSGRENFNTSHVTVYLTHYQTGISITIFQYISCYCLSLLPFRLYDPVLLFQYISCYCLSNSSDSYDHGTDISIHLMLLFIVSGDNLVPRPTIISIHLMLLFIH